MTRALRPLLVALGIFGVLAMVAVESDARPKINAGSRGARTNQSAPATPTAPTTAAPIQRTQTQAPPASAARPAAAPNTGAAAAAKPGMFSRPGLMGGLVAGMLGAGLFGLLAGQGLFGNLAGMASFFGLLLQIALIGGVVWFALRWFRNRQQQSQQPAFAGGPAPDRMAYATGGAEAVQPAAPVQNSGSGYGLGSFLKPQQQAPVEPTDEIGIVPADYDSFERLLVDVQTAYSREDKDALEKHVTPEMLGYLGEEVVDNVGRGVQAQLSGVKLLQGDLAEAWNEGPVDYATVAMRYEIIDTVVDRKTKAVVEGDPSRPVEAVELWTFVRPKGTQNWTVSAIQQMEDEPQA